MVTRVRGAMIQDGTVGTADLTDAAVTNAKLADDAAGTVNIIDTAVTAAKLADTLDLSGKVVTLPYASRAGGYVEIREEQTSGTDAGTFTQDAWQVRVLNTEHADADGLAALATNQVTLAAGTYECDIVCPAYAVGSHQARLYNATGAAAVLIGTSQASGSGDATMTASRITGRFTVAAAQALQVEHYCETTNADDGFGHAAGFGVTEVFTVARFWRVA